MEFVEGVSVHACMFCGKATTKIELTLELPICSEACYNKYLEEHEDALD